MKTIEVGAFEAKTHFSQLLDEVEGGAVVRISRRGKGAELIRDTIGINGQIFVPALFWYELGNALVMAEWADRIAPRCSAAAVSEYARLPIVTHQQSDFPTADRILKLARENELTCYDASCLR
jgi:predicted nucleic acid-binding protein